MQAQVKGPTIKRWAGMFVTLLVLAVVLYPTVSRAEVEISGSFGTEGWVPPQGETRIVAVETPSFGAEDWVPPQGETRVVKVETPSFGAEDWVGAMKSSEAVGTGAIPAPAREELSLDDYNPD